MTSKPAANLDVEDMGTGALPGRAVLEIATVRSLSRRSNIQGLLRFTLHLTLMGLTGTLVWLTRGNWYLCLPAMFLHGVTIVTMFAPMHECVHKTAFASPILNEVFGWLAGLISFYNFTYYRYYHTWHHRFTQDPARDPELMSPKPKSVKGYLWEISGLEFWFMRPLTFAKLSLGLTNGYPFVPSTARKKIAISAAIQSGIYLVGLSFVAVGYSEPLYLFFLPALLGQPILRAILIAEHTGCSADENGLTNTRTTLTTFPIRLLMWNMPFHTEHHLYPSIPFHRLPNAHAELRAKLVHLESGYVRANRVIIRSLVPLK